MRIVLALLLLSGIAHGQTSLLCNNVFFYGNVVVTGFHCFEDSSSDADVLAQWIESESIRWEHNVWDLMRSNRLYICHGVSQIGECHKEMEIIRTQANRIKELEMMVEGLQWQLCQSGVFGNKRFNVAECKAQFGTWTASPVMPERSHAISTITKTEHKGKR